MDIDLSEILERLDKLEQLHKEPAHYCLQEAYDKVLQRVYGKTEAELLESDHYDALAEFHIKNSDDLQKEHARQRKALELEIKDWKQKYKAEFKIVQDLQKFITKSCVDSSVEEQSRGDKSEHFKSSIQFFLDTGRKIPLDLINELNALIERKQ